MQNVSLNNVLIVDLETTGLNPDIDEIIEIGAILYFVPNVCIIQQFSTLLHVNSNNAVETNKIHLKATQTLSFNEEIDFINIFYKLIDRCDYLVAHNAEFDQQWFGRNNSLFPDPQKSWLCTYKDFIWPNNTKPASLINTALNHDIAITSAHRALTDCQLIASLFNRLAEKNILEISFRKAIQRKNEPNVIVVAHVSYDQRDLAKKFNFTWDNEVKLWKKELKTSDYELEKNQYKFKYSVD